MLLHRNLYYIISLALTVQGCIKILPDAAPARPQYVLDISLPEPSDQQPIRKTLVVEQPYTSSTFNTRDIIVKHEGDTPRLTFAQNQEWNLRLPEMLEEALINAIRQTSGIQGVGHTGQDIKPDYILVSDLEAFQIVYYPERETPDIEIRWQLKLLKTPERKIIAVKDIAVVKKVPLNRFSSIFHTFNIQTSKIMHDISLWVRHHMAQE